MNVQLLRCGSRVAFAAVAVVFVAMWLSSPTYGAEETDSTIWINRIHVCRSVVEREPVEVGDSFPEDIKQLYCFTEVRDAGEETFVTHEWYHEDELKASVKLKAMGAHWRTWSSKRIDASWTGNWRVEIKDADGRKIASVVFTVGAVEQEEGEEDSQPDED